jgi:hypothetical protein
MNFTIYDSTTGQVQRWGSCPDEVDIQTQVGTGEAAVEGCFPADAYYWNGFSMMPLPPRPSPDYDFDFPTKTWVLNTTRLEADVRARRTRLLRESDWTQLPDVADTTRLAWQPYRQSLRDIPLQPGYPTAITWPVAPASGTLL